MAASAAAPIAVRANVPAAESLLVHLRTRAATAPDSPALHDDAGIVTCAQLVLRAERLAAGLAAHGLRRGDVVAVQLPNSVAFVVTLLGATALGAVVQTVHMTYRRAELGSLLAHSGARMFIAPTEVRDAAPAATAVALRDDSDAPLPALRTVVAVGAPVAGAVDFASLYETAPLASLPAVGADDPYVLLYTSGTTADPKGVPTTARRFLGNAADAVEAWSLGPQDVLLAAAPFTHLYGLFVLQCGLLAGAALSLLPVFTPPALAATVRRDRATAVFAGPAHLRPLLDQGALRADDFGSVRLLCLSGTAVPPALARAVEAALPAGRVIQLWGMSELQAGAYGRADDPATVRHETAGRPAARTELRVLDDAGIVVAPGTEGRLQVRGAAVFDGYLDNPRATAAAFHDGWFDTGDTALLRPDGALVITGRLKELIDRGGVKFNPVDVELLLDAVPGVGRCALAPMPDPVLGERACAFVVPDGSAEVRLESLTAALDAAGVAKFKWPERLEFVGALPMTPTQKVRRAVLTGIVKERMSR